MSGATFAKTGGGTSADRGRYLGALYIARRPCGKASAMSWDDLGCEKETAKLVARCIARGDRVERIERYENDPQPEWICRSGCTDCAAPNKAGGGCHG